MKYFLNGNDFITGWNALEDGGHPEPLESMLEMGAIFDAAGNPRFKLVDNEIIEITENLITPEQHEELRKAWCREEIFKLYPPDKEAQILREAISGTNVETFSKYNEDIQSIIEQSYLETF